MAAEFLVETLRATFDGTMKLVRAPLKPEALAPASVRR